MTVRVVQRRRTRGWRKPPGAVIVDRTSRWGNPFVVVDGDRAGAVDAFRTWIETGQVTQPSVVPDDALASRRRWILDHAPELAGRILVCWCPQPGPCHAHVLVELARRP